MRNLFFVPVLFLLTSMIPNESFEQRQRAFPRVKSAFEMMESRIQQRCEKIGVSTAEPIFIRAFKEEKEFEIWKLSGNKYVLYDSFRICHTSGTLGPKKKQGDLQVPEGVYHVQVFNPASNYHLSLGLNYPNKRDEIVNKAPRGGDIYIHGDCVSAGCMAMTDIQIEEIYSVAVLAKSAGQENIPVHVFPYKMNIKNVIAYGKRPEYKQHAVLWRQLQMIYADFETKRQVPDVVIDVKGNYLLAGFDYADKGK
jgi:murein L,D-transpeptidase YafK